MGRIPIRIREEPRAARGFGARAISLLWSLLCWLVAFGSVLLIYAMSTQ
jgi:hypothetical protein